MKKINIRTHNGAKHNPHLSSHHRRVQNRAAAVLDAWDEFGESNPIDVVAHMHRLSVIRIKKDLYGDPANIKKIFGTKSSSKLEHALKKCIKEMDEGVNSALVAVAHNIPFMLIRKIQNNQNVKQVATQFLRDIINRSNENEQEENDNGEIDEEENHQEEIDEEENEQEEIDEEESHQEEIDEEENDKGPELTINSNNVR
jgi:hypothetical protein